MLRLAGFVLLSVVVITACGANSADSTGVSPVDGVPGGDQDSEAGASQASAGEDSAAAPADAASTTNDGSGDADVGIGGDVAVGAEVLAADGFSMLAARRVGVILNHASTVDGASLLDVLVAAPEVDVVAAFGPEHGVRGTAPAGVDVTDSVDDATGVPVYSLYGDQRAPSAAVLADLDVLVFDLQDVGARPYTYLSTMGLAMQAAAEAGVAFMVLDRPNPLGGEPTSGWVLDPAYESFVGSYPIPMIHGLTAGELASAIKGEGWLDGLDGLDLQIVTVDGWSRQLRWPDVGRAWVAPSPSLPSWESAAVYPGTVLFEATAMSVGRGTSEPFTTLGAPWVDSAAFAAQMNDLGLPGVRFEPVRMRPEPSEAAPNPPFANEDIGGIRIVPTDGSFRPFETGVHLLVELRAHAGEQGGGELIARPDFLDLLAGTDVLRVGLINGQSSDDLIAGWTEELADFETLRQRYFLYPAG
ncbi:MAG: exo-beta-N-acetylmuramidase NamZ family protein [Acidimicrobiales bacterium]